RNEYRKLGRTGNSVRDRLSRDVAAALARGTPARETLEHDVNTGLTISGLRVARAEREILRGIDLAVAPGELCALMGASGSGKTTVLRSVAALQSFDAGAIAIGD